ncbi:uncharacterized protein LOC131680640 [Topomyia yanbarensis]|uniref:uncharacterized protein LOC131680640 n=1 Tax=Topomyia yanbarensis TaxID=2498891 RepID=UPI00273B48DC|nr:uncharacterized protein LOC131680640 [Topomyia yanbarensis]
MPIKNNEFNSNIKQSPPVSTLTGEVPDTSDAPPAAVDTGPLEHQQGSTFNIPISIRFTHSPSISGQPDRNPENPSTQQSQTTGTTTASNAPHLAGPQSRRSPRLIPKMTPVSGKLTKQLHCNKNRFGSPDIPAPGGPPGRTLSRETPTHQQQRVRRDLSPVPGCSWHPVRFRPSRKPVVTNRDTHFPLPALTGDVPPYSDAPPAAAGAGSPGTSRVSPYQHSNRQEQFSATNSFSRNDRTADVWLTTRFRKRYQNLPATKRTKTTDTTPADPLLYLPRSLEGTYARPPINNCNKNYPLNTNKAHEADSFLSREKASSPAPALSADVPALTDEPSAAAGAGGPDHHRVSLTTPYSHQDQSYGSESFPGSPPRSPNSVSMTNSTGSEYSTLAVQWNINGLRNNLGDLQNIIAGTEPLCLAIQETHLHTGVDPTPWFGNRYDWETARGDNNHQTIGLGIKVELLSVHLPLNTELIAVARRISTPIRCSIVSIYLPQGVTNIRSQLTSLINQVPAPFIVMGDLNAHHKAWGSDKCCHRGNEIVKLIEEIDAVILNDGSTTFIRGNASSALDVTFASSSIAGICGWSTSNDTAGSDHFPIVLRINRLQLKTTRRRRWLYENADWDAYDAAIQSHLVRDRTYSLVDLSETIVNAAKETIPRTSGVPPHRAVHWWNPEVAAAVKARRKALRTLQKTPPNHPLRDQRADNFRTLRNAARKTIQTAKETSWRNFVDGIHTDSSTTELWRRVNALSGKRRQNGYSLAVNNTTITDPEEMANKIGCHFETLSADKALPAAFAQKKSRLEASPTTFTPDSAATYNRPFTGAELAVALTNARGKSDGPDRIGYPMLRHLPPGGKRALLDSFNTIWERGSFPEEWKLAHVVPIPKKCQGTRAPSDFRPISLLSCTAKTLERMVNRRLTTWLEDEKLLDPRQFAFRKGFGTGAHLGSLGEVLDRARSEGIHADIAILDIAKAYNTVWREGVLQQLQRWGVQGNLGVFIQNFLTNRRFRVCIGGTLSDEFREANGVPQGSILAVTLFLVRMNSLFTALPGGVYVFVYADDIILVALGKTIPRTRISLQAAVNAVGRWALATGFNIAATKCAITHCCSTYHPANARPIRLNSTVIPFRKEPVVLGITLDRKLTMIPHFRRLKKDCQSRKRLVRTICAHHPKNNRRAALNVVRSLIHSRIFYGIEMTCRNLDGLSDILGPLYHGAVRLASGLLPSTPAEAACVEAGVLPCRWETARVAFRRALSFLEKTSGDECPLLTTASNLHQEFTSNDLPPIARLHRVRPRAWYDPGPNTDDSLARIIKVGDHPSSILVKYRQLINRRYSHHTKIFTDGSKANDGVGAGISGLGNGLSFRLPPSCSVFSAEAAAIAVGMIKRPTDTPTVILTDSLSVLRDVASGTSKHPFVQAIETLRDPLVTICWVPGHSGIKGNTDADRLALIGRRARTRLPNETPTIDIIREFNISLQNGFTNHWRSSRNHTQKIKGSADTWTDRDSQREQKILSRLRVGHTRVTHAHTVSSEPVPECASCNTRLTVEHLLCNCRELEDLRRQYGLTGSIRDTLSNDPVREEALLLFLKDAGLYDSI